MLLWLENLPISVWVREAPSVWGFATVITLHTMGMALLVGSNWVLDVRLLGLGRHIPLSAFNWLFRLMAIGFIVNLVTGVLLFAQAATNWGTSLPFLVKMCFVVAGVVTLVLIRSHVSENGSAEDVTTRGRRLAVASILAWSGAVTAGRLLAYIMG